MLRKIALLLFLLPITLSMKAQLKAKNDCGLINVDVYKGWINDVKPNADPEQIKAKLPCFTLFEKEGNESKCGGGIYYEDKDLKFYIQREYLVIGEKFKGKLSVPLLGASQDDLFGWFGNPKVADPGWEAFQTAYGTLIVYYNEQKKVNKVIMSTKTTDEIDLCNE
ncbi:MAG: hypothetical protein ACOVP6_07135 [Lacibacter sp.]